MNPSTTLTKQEKIDAIKNWFGKTKLDSAVVKSTLGDAISNISPQLMLKASEKLIKVNKGEQDPDDRDHLKFSFFLGPEDYFKEHIEKDAGKLSLKARTKMQQKANLSWLHSGFFTPQIRSVVIGNSLANNVDGINPIEHYDNSHRVTKLGEGGIASVDAVPDSSRQVSTSTFGFIDPMHMLEGENIGVTQFLNNNVVKGRDNKLYRVMKDNRDNKTKWVDHETLAESVVEIPQH